MQCANCQFENMPGVKACGRCGASLQLSAMAISVHPPRAGAWAKRWRRWFWLPRFSWRRAAEGAIGGLIGRVAEDGPALPVVVRMIVPGWPQFYQGDRSRGGWFLGSFATLAALGLAMLGSGIGSICLGLAVAVHASSVLDIVIMATSQSAARLTYALACLISVGAAVYLPLSYLGNGWVVPRRLNMNVPPFAAGDTVLLSPATYSFRSVRPGDVVLYRLPATTMAGRTPGNYPANYALAGERIDRVLAGPGQRVQIEAGKLLVDGHATDDLPLNPTRMPGVLNMEVPPGMYLILPTTALSERYDLAGLNWQQVSVVPARGIVGRVYVRNWPWWRFRLF